MGSWWPLRLFSSRKQSPKLPFEARLAIYESFDKPPVIHLLAASDCLSYVNLVTQKVSGAAAANGGNMPEVAVREIVENLLHAEFRGATISVYPGGNRILVADQGPGIPDKEAAIRPGFSTSNTEMRRFIKGVGSGLTVAREALEALGGSLVIEDNLHGGTVVTLTVPLAESTTLAVAEAAATSEALESEPAVAGDNAPQGEYKRDPSSRVAKPKAVRKARAATSRETSRAGLTPRQEKVLCLFSECPELGPSTVAERGEISLASAYRDLVALEGLGLAEPVEGGKRRLTDKGRECLASLNS